MYNASDGSLNAQINKYGAWGRRKLVEQGKGEGEREEKKKFWERSGEWVLERRRFGISAFRVEEGVLEDE